MSLIPFHKGLISTGIVFCVGFAAWTFRAYLRDGGWTTLALSLGFALLAVGLGVYLRHLRRFLRLDGARGGE